MRPWRNTIARSAGSRCAAEVVLAVLVVAAAFASPAWSADTPATRPGDESTLLPVPENMRKDIPPPRSRAELEAILEKVQTREPLREVHIVLVAGPKDHGPGEHDYPAWQKAWQRLLAKAPKTRVTTAWEKPSEDDLKSADVLVIFKHTAWPRELNDGFDKFLARGGGIVLFHFAVDCNNNTEAGRHLGLYWGQGAKFRHGWLDLKFEDQKHELLRGFAGRTIRFHDESYWRLTGDPKQIELLAVSPEEDDGKTIPVPMVWNREVGKGRVHVNIMGHYNWTFNDPLFRILALRGIAWAASEPVDRFASLVTTDVKLTE